MRYGHTRARMGAGGEALLECLRQQIAALRDENARLMVLQRAAETQWAGRRPWPLPGLLQRLRRGVPARR